MTLLLALPTVNAQNYSGNTSEVPFEILEMKWKGKPIGIPF